MSWDSYIDNLLAQSKDTSGNAHADRACIIGLDGSSPWTTDSHARVWNEPSYIAVLYCVWNPYLSIGEGLDEMPNYYVRGASYRPTHLWWWSTLVDVEGVVLFHYS